MSRSNHLTVDIYFTTRRILWEMGGIQGASALPGDPTFSLIDNHYDVPSYKRLCAEFGISPYTDFSFKRGASHGLGKVFIWVTDMGLEAEDFAYPGLKKFTDQGGNLINFIRNDLAKNLFDHFMIHGSEGLSQAGTARLNQSIEPSYTASSGLRSTLDHPSLESLEVRRRLNANS